MRFFSFTVASAAILLCQQFYYRVIIDQYRNENNLLKRKIYLGHKKHLEIIEEKDLEKNAAIASVQYSYSNYVESVESKDFKSGYKEGYHRGIKDSNCPASPGDLEK